MISNKTYKFTKLLITIISIAIQSTLSEQSPSLTKPTPVDPSDKLKCENFLKKLSFDSIWSIFSSQTHLTAEEKDTIALSGKFPEQMGRYASCHAQKDSTYALVRLEKSGNDFIDMGLCLPIECTVNLLQSTTDALSKKLPAPYNDPSVYHIHIIDVNKKLQEKTYDFGFWGWFVFMGVLTLLILFATSYNYWSGLKNKKKHKIAVHILSPPILESDVCDPAPVDENADSFYDRRGLKENETGLLQEFHENLQESDFMIRSNGLTSGSNIVYEYNKDKSSKNATIDDQFLNTDFGS